MVCLLRALAAAVAGLALAGCGTTRMSDTARTGTERLLLSNAIDRAINEMNFQSLAGKDVYFDPQYLRNEIDAPYIESSIRQHLLANGVVLKANREEATYVVEARAGAVGTNRHDVLLGIPAVTLPNVSGTPGVPSIIPEIPLAKSTQQKGVAKLAAFAYNQQTGQPVWQSGVFPIVSTARDTWVFGTGPFQRGSIYDGTRFAGSKILLPFARDKTPPPVVNPAIPVTAEAVFFERQQLARATPRVSMKSKPAAKSDASPPSGGGAPGSTASSVSGGLMGGTTSAAPSGASGTPPDASGGNSAQGLLFLGEQGSFFQRSKTTGS